MGFEHIRSWYELEEINEQQERMITAYEIKIKQLEQENADIVVFPELVVTGYPPQDLLWEEGFVEQNLAIINQIGYQVLIE